MKNIIFLDVDGVLNANSQGESSDIGIIDSGKVRLLAQIIKLAGGAEVVLHSGWRFWFDGKLCPIREEAKLLAQILECNGIVLYDVTPDFATEEIKASKKFSLVKAKEILYWLKEHPEAGNWLVIDDLDLHDKEIEKHQLRPDGKCGLTEEDVETAVRVLTRI